MQKENPRRYRDSQLTLQDYVAMAERQTQHSGDLDGMMEEGIDESLAIIENPDAYFTQVKPSFTTVESEIKRRQKRNAAMITASRGNLNGMVHIGAMLVTEPGDSKATLSSFLGLLTDGEIGRTPDKTQIVTKDEILLWVSAIKDRLKPPSS